ncbi:hypothetical protein F888_00416 [Acinetobacter courvalinii]|uniref:Uncharacterized protein n=2 Tax=Acinetobacter courvalinii TaxID=280147 RepID=N9Q560_9GAMM|nr:hypothetical protein F888_00416 [Acinetobacter courvalinii]RSN79892.1 hypothetical protein EA770_16770 [Acinetobacter baumannii]
MKSFINARYKVFRYASVQMLSKSLTLLSTYIIAMHATNEVFGYISLIQSSLVVAITFLSFNLSSGVVRYFYEKNTLKIFSHIKPIITFLFFLSIFIFIFLFIFLENSSFFWFSLLPIIGYINGLLLIVSMLSRANNNLYIYMLAELTRPFFLIVVAIAYIYMDFDIVSIFLFALLLSCLLSFFLCILKYDSLINKNIEEESSVYFSTKIIIIYTAPLFFVQIMSLVNNVSDKYILQHYMGVEEVGLYGKAYLIGSSLGLLLDSLMLLWTPFVIKNRTKLINVFSSRLILCSVGVCIFSLIVLCIAYISFYFKLEFKFISNQMIVISLIIVSAFISRIGYQILTPLINAYDKTTWVAKISFISMLLGILLNFLLIPVVGGYGAAIATFISFVTYSIMAIFIFLLLRKSLVLSEG